MGRHRRAWRLTALVAVSLVGTAVATTGALRSAEGRRQRQLRLDEHEPADTVRPVE